jgi:hypothetical protein
MPALSPPIGQATRDPSGISAVNCSRFRLELDTWYLSVHILVRTRASGKPGVASMTETSSNSRGAPHRPALRAPPRRRAEVVAAHDAMARHRPTVNPHVPDEPPQWEDGHD